MPPPDMHEREMYVRRIDMDLIVAKLAIPDKSIARVWKASESRRAIEQYKNFLSLYMQFLDSNLDVQFHPSDDIDEIWHHHILDTQAYFGDCNFVFGSYFHHYPYAGRFGEFDPVEVDRRSSLAKIIPLIEYGQEF